MAFKRGLKSDWVVTRPVKFGDSDEVSIKVKVIPKKDGEAITAKGDDIETVRGFVTTMDGYQDEKGKPLTLDDFLADCESGELAPAYAAAVAIAAINAQYDAAIKN